MDKGTLLELEIIQANLSDGIGLIAVVSDGLISYKDCTLEGCELQKYVIALCWIRDKLSSLMEELGKRIPSVSKGGAA